MNPIDFENLSVGDRVALHYAGEYLPAGHPNPVLATVVEVNPPNSLGEVGPTPCFDAMPDGGVEANDAWTVFETEVEAGYVTVTDVS